MTQWTNYVEVTNFINEENFSWRFKFEKFRNAVLWKSSYLVQMQENTD